MGTSGPDPPPAGRSDDDSASDDEVEQDLAFERELHEVSSRLHNEPVRFDPDTEAVLRRRLSGDS